MKIINQLAIAFVFIFLLMASGCGSEPDDLTIEELQDLPEKYPWNGQYDIETQTGFLVTTDRDPRNIGDLVEHNWRLMQRCTNIFLDPDRPIAVEYNDDLPSGYVGFHYATPQYVHIRAYRYDVARFDTGYMEVTRHEMIHELQRLNSENDPHHESDIWECQDLNQ